MKMMNNLIWMMKNFKNKMKKMKMKNYDKYNLVFCFIYLFFYNTLLYNVKHRYRNISKII